MTGHRRASLLSGETATTMQYDYHVLDVFTDKPFHGNPLAVVLGADGLSTELMQTVASEFNLSETIFLATPENALHSAKARIFTPKTEVPFAGHPTVGAAILLAALQSAGGSGEHDALISIEQALGTVRVGVRKKAGASAYAEFDAPKLPKDAGQLPPVDKLAAGIGLILNEIGFENHKPRCFAAGPAFALIPVSSLDAIGKAAIDPRHWSEAFDEQGIVGAYLYTRQCRHTTSAFHARLFAPSAGIPEDPATGSAAVCLAGAVNQFDALPDGSHRRVVEQGYFMGRPSEIVVTAIVKAGKLEAVRIGGRAVSVMAGKLTLP
ncbi:MAG: PhzF family phenazine biosynthesis protein [Hyphomicrobiaceae bacterium]|nr:PhzF family phenazine biosynthesis protein [Hyphomicrobiaceae bacterium]